MLKNKLPFTANDFEAIRRSHNRFLADFLDPNQDPAEPVKLGVFTVVKLSRVRVALYEGNTLLTSGTSVAKALTYIKTQLESSENGRFAVTLTYQDDAEFFRTYPNAISRPYAVTLAVTEAKEKNKLNPEKIKNIQIEDEN